MGTLNEDLSAIKEVEDKIVANKVARFAYTDEAYTTNDANGVAEYDVNKEQNIPTADASVLKVNETVLSRGYRAQASSVTRMLLNHFFGRMSYNLNKVNDNVSNLIATLIRHRGAANGFATLDENGRVPDSQLPESAAGDVKTVNSVLPTNGNVALTGENIPVSSSNATLLSAPLTTDRYADSSITNAKIKDPISVAKGGTGQTTANDAANAFINSLTTGTDVPVDDDYYVCQSAGGGTTTTTYRRKPVSKLWEYIKDKISSVLGLTASDYSGTASKATTADYAKNMYEQVLDLSSLDKTKFYPLVCSSSFSFAEVAIYSEGGPDGVDYNQNRIHFEISTTGWNDTPFTLNIRDYACYANEEVTIGCIGRGVHTGGWALWLRGGVRYICQSRSSDLSLQTSDYTYGDEVYTVGTNYYGGTNSNVTTVFTPQSTITSGAYSNRDLTASAIKAEDGFIGNVTGTATNAYSGMVHTCSTSSSTKDKTVSIPGFSLTEGACIRVKFLYGNATSFPTLNVNNTGAHQIIGARGSLNVLIESSSDITTRDGLGVASWDTSIVLDLYYDGSSWIVIGDPVVKRFYSASERRDVTITGVRLTGFLH